jgi:hypothetical protein
MKILFSAADKMSANSAVLFVEFTLPDSPNVYVGVATMDLEGKLREDGLCVIHKDETTSIDNVPMPDDVVAAIQEVAIQQANKL